MKRTNKLIRERDSLGNWKGSFENSELMKNVKLTTFLIAILLMAGNSWAQNDNVKLKKIFNGKNLKGWDVPENNIWWSVEKGILKVKSGPNQTGTILWTSKVYKDFIIQADFLLGDGRVDSGIFIRDEKQQIQIGESGSLKRDMTCSPYIPGKGYPAEAEGIADLLKKDDWNTIKIKAVGKDYTIWLNGKQVLEFHSEDALEEGKIGIQLHPNRDMTIDYKNIKATEI
ncbi:3-keto-disaccharide hydrolase [Flexithrix dorotheae]|uniref:3-keto-disaccharide hydrolase n=1 Tax=Flexithrix dorotheae TaxID=70993 RepID=UPI00035D8128|nr:DUF1080 domain-containing protein [Flexithrix dorotheae]